MRARRGQSEVIGAILVIPVIVSLFIVGSSMMQQSVEQLERANDKIRENLLVIPLYYNGTLYAKILNTGPRPVRLAYIILYSINETARRVVAIEQADNTIAPGDSITTTIARVPEGKYEVEVVTRLGNVFGWDPSIGPVFSVPPRDAVLGISRDSPVMLSQIIGEALASEVLSNYSVVGYVAYPGVVFSFVLDAAAYRRSGSATVYSYVRFNIEEPEHVSSNDKPLRYSYYKQSGPVRLGIRIYADAWASRDRSGVQANITYLIEYLGNRSSIVVTRFMPPQIIAPGPLESPAFMVRLGEISIVNGTLLGGHNGSLVIMFNGTGSASISYIVWKPKSNVVGTGVWTVRVSTPASGFSDVYIIFLREG